MEYLSDVRISTSKKTLRVIKEALKEVKSNLWDVCDYIHEFTGKDNLKYVIFGWNNIEWFLNYKDIFVLERTLKSFKAKGIPFKFIRIGEKASDIEEDSNTECNYLINNAEILKQMLQKV